MNVRKIRRVLRLVRQVCQKIRQCLAGIPLRHRALELRDLALKELTRLGARGESLSDLARYVVSRVS